MHAAAVLLLVSAATFASGALQVPDFGIWARSLAAGGAHASDNGLRTAFHAAGHRDAVPPRDEAQPAHWHTIEPPAPANASAASVPASLAARAAMAAERFGASVGARTGQDAALHCGSGPLACRLGDRVELEPMGQSPAARPTGGLQ
jgi:hypothetical protein